MRGRGGDEDNVGFDRGESEVVRDAGAAGETARAYAEALLLVEADSGKVLHAGSDVRVKVNKIGRAHV